MLDGLPTSPVPSDISAVPLYLAVVSANVPAVVPEIAPVRSQPQPRPIAPVAPQLAAIQPHVVAITADVAEPDTGLPLVAADVCSLPDLRRSLRRQEGGSRRCEAEQE